MNLYHVVATSDGNVIGKENQLPWYISADLKHFKHLTTGSTVIMGRKTFESIGKQPLPNRQNFVLSHSRATSPSATNLKFFNSLEDALMEVKTPAAFIAGGADLYRQTINLVDGIYLTRISGTYKGDARYPEIPAHFSEKKGERKILQENPKVEAFFYENTKRSSTT